MPKVTLILAAIGMALQPTSGSAAASDREQLERLNAIWLKSYETRDRAGLGSVLADDFVGLYGNAVLSKQQMLDGLVSRPHTRVSWEKLRINVRGDTAVVDAASTITIIREGAEATARYHYVDVYSRRSSQWQAIASHVVRQSE